MGVNFEGDAVLGLGAGVESVSSRWGEVALEGTSCFFTTMICNRGLGIN